MAHTGKGYEPGAQLASQDVLDGRILPSALEMIDLIREVNPTGKSTSKRETERRYAIKSKLQSLLIQRFQAELAIERDDDEGVVLWVARRIARKLHNVLSRSWVVPLGAGVDCDLLSTRYWVARSDGTPHVWTPSRWRPLGSMRLGYAF